MKIFESMGTLVFTEDANGVAVDQKSPAFSQRVYVRAKYEVKPSSSEALSIDVFGHGVVGLGQTKHRLELENGVTLNGRLMGGNISPRESTNKLRRAKFFDVDEDLVQLYQDKANASNYPEIDRLIFPIASSSPLGHGSCTSNGHWSQPGRPFSFRAWRRGEEMRGSWSTHALRLEHDGMDILIAQTNSYWRKHFDPLVGHDSISGIRQQEGGLLDWKQVNDAIPLFEAFLGWLNHCASPVAVLKGYRKGRLVYKAYRIRPNASRPRDAFSWLPLFGLKDEASPNPMPDEVIQDLFNKFAGEWLKNRESRSTLHIALQFLRSRERGSPSDPPSTLYLRNAFTACSLLLAKYSKSQNDRLANMRACLGELAIDDVVPAETDDLEWLAKHCKWLWSNRNGDIDAEALKGRTLSRPLSNFQNWLVHFDEPRDAARILDTPRNVQAYLVEVAVWLADLMLLKGIGYRGCYFNRLNRRAEKVPWA